MPTSNRFLIVQLADIGDLVLSTPAMAALREAHPQAHIALLTSAHAAPIVETPLVDEIITFDRRQFNSSRSLLKPSNLRRIFGLRKGRYDTVIYLHHFTLKPGTIKFWLIGRASSAKRRIGLQNGNGWFLTDSITDGGFGAKHQAQYWLDLMGLLGANPSPRPAKVNVDTGFEINGGRGVTHHAPTNGKNGSKPLRIIIHAGSGGYSLARRWDAEKFAAVADALHDEFDAQIILVGSADDDNQAVKAAMKTEPLDLTGQTSLGELAAVIQQADLFIGADSGVTHIAGGGDAHVAISTIITGRALDAGWKVD
jgi:heptosyltransferase-2